MRETRAYMMHEHEIQSSRCALLVEVWLVTAAAGN